MFSYADVIGIRDCVRYSLKLEFFGARVSYNKVD